MQKRGQVTIFVIVGILLLFTIIIITWLVRIAEQDRLDAQAQEAVDAFIQTTALNHYITSCLDKVASEGLHVLTTQGGVIYDYQGGLTATSSSGTSLFEAGFQYYPYRQIFYENGNLVTYDYNISYAIRPYVDCPSFVYARANLSDEATSEYPVARTFFADYTSRFSSYFFANPPGCNLLARRTTWSGYLGKNNLPSLCSYNGINLGKGVCNSLFGFDIISEQTAMERQLESYIQTQLPTCVNISTYELYSGSNVTIIDAPNISILFQKPRGVLVQAEYPFLVSIDGKEPILKQALFQKTLPVAINNFFNYVFMYIKKAVSDPFFSLLEDWNDVTKNSFYLPYYDVRVQHSAHDCTDSTIHYCTDKVLRITDTSSELLGKPLTFQFAIAQRKPVLDYLQDPTVSMVINDDQINYRYQINDTISLPVAPMDPDGDAIEVNVSGWKETFDEHLDVDSCNEQPNGCTLENHWKHMVRTDLSDDAIRWTESGVFLTPSYRMEYKTNDADFGIHNVTIVVTDEYGLRDFQIVRILVLDLPKAVLEVYNLFEDINNSFASVEDPYVLNGSASAASILLDGSLTDYQFEDLTEEVLYVIQEDTLRIPVPDGITIENITLVWFNKSRLLSQTSQEHELMLIVKQDTITSNPDTTTITVAQCLPHGYTGYNTSSPTFSRNHFSTDAYPYYQPSGNPYAASHVCCEPSLLFSSSATNPPQLKGGSYAPSSVRCFEDTFRTTYPFNSYTLLNKAVIDAPDGEVLPVTKDNYESRFDPDSYRVQAYGGQTFYQTSDAINFKTNNQLNDIWHVTYGQACSGYRGNTCGGKLSTEWTITSCDDFNLPSNQQFARCQGPNTVGFNVESPSLTCASYSGTTFEQQLYDSISSESALQERFEKVYTDEEFEAIMNGQCAGPTAANLQSSGDMIVALSAGAFSCMGVCDAGNCGFTNLRLCSCDVTDACNSFNAQDFLAPDGTVLDHRCLGSENEVIACTRNCQVSPANTQASCECRGGSYFGGNCCEFGTTNIFTGSSQGCFQGTVFSPNEVADTTQGSTIFCGDQFYVCGLSTTFTHSLVAFIDPGVGATYCGFTCMSAGPEWKNNP